MTEIVETVRAGRDLDASAAAAAMRSMMSGEALPGDVAALLTALREKGESPVEVAAMAAVMREFSLKVHTDRPVVDTCGTGGDGSGSVNLSTMAALVAAGAGVPVAKHGNRAASSACGSADVLEALGVAIDLPPKGVEACIEEAGIGFCFAPRFHPAMRHVGTVRRELGVRTVFNILGPLTNPAGARRQVIGVADEVLLPLMAGAMALLGTDRTWFIHGPEGMDELTAGGVSTVWEVAGEVSAVRDIDPHGLGLEVAGRDALRGGDASANAHAAREVLAGTPGPVRDAVVLNAAAVLVVAGVASDLASGVSAATESIDRGDARGALERLIAISARFV